VNKVVEDDFEEIDPELDEELLNMRLFPVLVRPNLGQPDFISPLNFREDSDKELPEKLHFEFNAIIAANKNSRIDDLIEEFDKKFFIFPLCEDVQDGRASRLDKIPIISKTFHAINTVRIDDPSYDNHPQEYLLTEKVFPGREKFYDIKFIFSLDSSIFYHTPSENSYFQKKNTSKFCNV
jgi:hypothetical protein